MVPILRVVFMSATGTILASSCFSSVVYAANIPKCVATLLLQHLYPLLYSSARYYSIVPVLVHKQA